MTKIDERAVVPALDSAAKDRLSRALDRDEVVAAFVFGSQAAGKAGPLSDIDVAVWLDPSVSRSEGWDLMLGLAARASEALRTDEVDLVVLNDASPLLRHRAIRTREMLLDRDPKVRVRLEAQAILEYLDTAPLRAALRAGLRRRLAEGTYGRRRQH